MTTITITHKGITATFNHSAPVKDAMKALNADKFEAVKIEPTRHIDKVREFMIHRR